MSRDKEEDIIDVDGSDEGEEEYEVESITGFKWDVSIAGVEHLCRHLARPVRSDSPEDLSSLNSWEVIHVVGVGLRNAMP